MISRRHLLLALGAGTLARPAPSLAQPTARVFRIGFLSPASASGYVKEVEAIRTGLRDLGYVEGKNIVIEYRWAEGDLDRLGKMAAELVAQKVDVLVTHALAGARAAMQATTTIPIVVADVIDPVAAGLVPSLARPGGNLTGSTSLQIEIQTKRLELLKELLPRLSRVAFLFNALNPVVFGVYRRSLEDAARSMRVELREFTIRESADLPEVFKAMTRARIDAAVIGEDPLLNANASVIAALAVTHRLPASGFTSFAHAGGLFGYGAKRPAVYARAAYFVDRVLRGTRAGDIPFERATTFDLIVNAKTAKALGLRIPAQLLQRADEVIE